MSLMTMVERMYPGDSAVTWLTVVAAGVTFLTMAAVLAARLRWLVRRPAPRHAVLFSALISALAMPALAVIIAGAGLVFAIPVLPTRQAASGHERTVDVGSAAAPMAPLPSPSRPAEVVRAEDVATTGVPAAALSAYRATIVIVLGLWALGSLVLFAGLARGIWRARLLRRSARLCDDPAVAVVPTVLVAPHLATPVVVGILRPVVILPEGLAGAISAEELRDVLHHEIAHARRRDPLVVLLQGIARALYWPIVPVHFLGRELEKAREEICDNHVLQDRDPIHYGETLLHLAELASGRRGRSLAATVGILHWRGKLESRIAGLLDAGRSTAPRTSRALACGILVLFLGTGALAASMRFVARADEPKPQPQPAARSEPPKPEGRSILVKAVGPDGSPMPGVAIEADIVAEPAYRGDRRFVTDGQGQVRITLPGGIEDFALRARADHCVPMLASWRGVDRPSTLFLGTFTVTSVRDGKDSSPRPVGASRIETAKLSEPPPAEFTFTMAHGFTIGGTVRDPEGRPIEGAKVEVRIPSSHDSRKQSQPDPQLATGDHALRTDANGRWSLDNVPMVTGFGLAVVASHSHYATGENGDGSVEVPIHGLKALRGGTDTITLRPAMNVRGTVSDPDGKPVPGAMVIADRLRVDPLAEVQAVRTDERGRFELPRQAIGKRTLTIVGEGWMPASRKVEIGPGQPPLDIRLDPGKDLRIRFVDRAGRPVPGVTVVIVFWHGGNALYGNQEPGSLDSKIPLMADNEGRFHWSWAPDDPVNYFCQKPGFQFEQVTLTADGQEHTVVLRDEPAAGVVAPSP